MERFAREAGGRAIYDGKFRYALAGKAWVLISAVFRSYDWMGEKPDTVTNAVWLDVDEDTLKANEPIAPEVFAIESLGIHEDALVTDAVADQSYRYDD